MSVGETGTPAFSQTWQYNGILQTSEIHASRGASTLWKQTLDYGGFDNNGNVRTQWIATGTKTYQQTYGYDQANRLNSIADSELPGGANPRSQNYGYDGFGNVWQSGGATGMPAMNYDAAGNLLWSQADGGVALTYDAEKSPGKGPSLKAQQRP